MPERLTATRRIDSAQVQGEGSYVVLRNLTVQEALDFIKTQSGNVVEVRASFLVDKLVEWNWVDGNGDPMPQPSEDALRLLTLAEQRWLMNQLFARPEAEQKN